MWDVVYDVLGGLLWLGWIGLLSLKVLMRSVGRWWMEGKEEEGGGGGGKNVSGDVGGGLGCGRTVLVTTGRQVKSLHVVRALKATGARVIVTDYQRISMSAVSVCCDGFYLLPELDATELDAWVDRLAEIIELEKVDLVVPVSTINEVLFMAVAKDRLQDRFPTTEFLCEGLEMTLSLDDKHRFSNLCEKFDVPTPEQGILTEPITRNNTATTTATTTAAKAVVPIDRMDVIFKRLESSSNREEEIVPVRRGQKPPAWLTPSEKDPWQWQRMLSGEEYSAWYICRGGKVTFSACYPSEPDLMHFDGMAVPADLDEKLTALLRELKLTGQYAFDFIREKSSGKCFVFECNPRASSILETVSTTPLWGEALLGVDVRSRTVYSNVGFVFHRNCWPFVWSRSEGILTWWDPLPFLAGEVLWPIDLIAQHRTLHYHHIDVNIGKIIVAGPSAPRNLQIFEALVGSSQRRRIEAAIRCADRVLIDANAIADPFSLQTSSSNVVVVAKKDTPLRPPSPSPSSITTEQQPNGRPPPPPLFPVHFYDGDDNDDTSLRETIEKLVDGGTETTVRAVLSNVLAKQIVDKNPSAPSDGVGDDPSPVVVAQIRSKANGELVVDVVPTRRMVVLHVIGSRSGTYYEGVSRYYGRECMESVEGDDVRFKHHAAYVHLDGSWTLDGSSKKMSFGDAINAIEQLCIDVVIPHMFDYLGMTAYRAVFDALGLDMVGCSAEALALSTHKGRAKAVVEQAGVKVPRSMTFVRGEERGVDRSSLTFPVVVKPCEEDNSMGVEIVRDPAELTAALEAAFQFGDEVLVEQYIPLGRELRVGIIEEADGTLRMLAVTEYILHEKTAPIRRPEDKLSTNTEGVPEGLATSGRKTPADDINDVLRSRLYFAATQSHRALGCKDYSVFDFRVDPNDEVFFLEACLYCSFAPKSALVTMADASEIAHPSLFYKFCEQTIAAADTRRRKSRQETQTQLLGMKKR